MTEMTIKKPRHDRNDHQKTVSWKSARQVARMA